MTPTHEVFNQVPPLEDHNLWEVDPLLQELSLTEDAKTRLQQFGGELGTRDMIRAGELANECKPVLSTHDRYGQRCTPRF